MHPDRKEDEIDNSNNTTAIRAPGFLGQHAIDAWEGEGGGLADILDGCDLARAAIADNVGWRASNNVGWLASHSPKKARREAVEL